MKIGIALSSLVSLLLLSCSLQELDIKDPTDQVFYASLEQCTNPDTRVYLNENVKVSWNADDHITIFNKYTYNQEYCFTGQTGAKAGSFSIVPNNDFVTGNDYDFICAVYPYQKSTEISNSGVLSLILPAEQFYLKDSFGLGANTMVSTTTDDQLMFKNVGGYLVLKFYGEDISVSSIKLEGNKGEFLSGLATMPTAVGKVPSITMSSDAGTSVTLVCDNPVTLGVTKEDATYFWLVVPPTSFAGGFTLTVTDAKGKVFTKKTTKNLSIVRNGVLRIAAIKVELS